MAEASGMGLGDSARDKAAAESYRRGNEALEKQNFGYAVECFGTCAKLKSANVMFRQILRGAEYKLYDDNKKGAGTLAKSKLIGIRSRIKKAKSKEEWSEADVQVEEGLKLNPWDAGLNSDLGEICLARGDDYLDIARFAFMCARNAEPDDKEHNQRFAEVLEAKGEFSEAAKVWRHICKLDPNDGNARSRATAADFEQTRTKGGYREAKTTQDVAVQRSEVLGKDKGKAADAPGMSEEQDLKHAIRKSPEEVENYLKLAHFYRTNRKLEEAHEQYTKALEVSGGDPKVKELLEDVELDRMRVNLLTAREQAVGHGELAHDSSNVERALRIVQLELLQSQRPGSRGDQSECDQPPVEGVDARLRGEALNRGRGRQRALSPAGCRRSAGMCAVFRNARGAWGAGFFSGGVVNLEKSALRPRNEG